jgi:NADPH-dependent ferric siderophore reductase
VSTRAEQYAATVLSREPLSAHLVRLTLGGPGLAGFTSTGVPDEWVGLIVPGQFQSRYYTVRSWTGSELTVDVVIHDEGLVTEWASRDCTGQGVTITEPRGSFAMPPGGWWLYLVGDLTALPAMARIVETVGPEVLPRVWAEAPEELPGYFAGDPGDVTWLRPPAGGGSRLATFVESLAWSEGDGYFWAAGESAQMRAIRKHLRHEVRLPSASYDVMGYWRVGAARRARAADPGPIWRAGKAAGRSDEQIWADYDQASDG